MGKKQTVFLMSKIVLWMGIGFLLHGAIFAQHHGQTPHPKRNKYRVLVLPADTTVAIGSEVKFTAYLLDTSGVRHDTTFSWSLTDKKIGSISQGGVFSATRSGSGLVVASAGKVSGTASIRVISSDWKSGYRVQIVPEDTTLSVGQTLPMRAYLVNRNGTIKDTTFQWASLNPYVGTIDENTGLFEAKHAGHAVVTARVGFFIGKAHILVERDSVAGGPGRERLWVLVLPRDTVTYVGQGIQFQAKLVDSQGNPRDTTFTWSVENETLGTISETGLFTATQVGHGFVFASVDHLIGKAHVTVLRDSLACDSLKNRYRLENRFRLRISPKDTIVELGHTVQFRAYLVETSGIASETQVRWEVVGRKIGTIDPNGLFTALHRGIGLVKAQKERWTVMARVMVIGSPQDTSQLDSVRVRFRNRSGEYVGSLHQLGEKDVLKISGLPFPLNILNGGEIAFQPGSLSGDVTLHISLPQMANVDTSVHFPQGILTGASFEVLVNGVPVHPFSFGSPVQIAFPIKKGLFDLLGISLEELGVFFADSSTLDTTGISNVVVDTASGMVYAETEHFSDLVVAICTSVTKVESGDRSGLQKKYTLYPNFPNPFNPETEIRFDISGTRAQKIRLIVYNLLGQEIRTLVQGTFNPGSYRVHWDGKDNLGRSVSTGIYLYRLEGEEFTLTRRMVLIK